MLPWTMVMRVDADTGLVGYPLMWTLAKESAQSVFSPFSLIEAQQRSSFPILPKVA